MRRSVRSTKIPLSSGALEHRWLHFLLLLGLFFEYARPASFVPGLELLRPYSLIPAVLFLGVMASSSSLRPWADIFGDRMVKWTFFYVFLMGCSVVHADVTLYVVEMVKLALGYLIYLIVIARLVVTRARLLGVFAALAAAHVFLIVMNPEFVLDPANRHYINGASFLGDPNDFGLSLCILVPMSIDLALSAKSLTKRILWWSVLLLLAISIVASQSRGATVGIIGVLAYLWLLTPRKVLTLIGVSALAAIMLYYASDAFFERMGTILTYREEGSAMGRITAWGAGIRMMLDHPLLGVGVGHFAVSFGTEYMPRDIIGPHPWLTAHSIYFLVLGELGIPGIVTLLVLIFGNLRLSSVVRRSGKESDDLKDEQRSELRTLYLMSASIVGFAVAGAFLSASYYPHIYILTALMFAQRRMVVEQLGLAPQVQRSSSGSVRSRRTATTSAALRNAASTKGAKEGSA